MALSSFSAHSSFSAFAKIDPLIEAILHTYSAVRAPDGISVAQHAAVAIIHANATKNDKDQIVDRRLLEDGIKSLDDAVKEGTSGNTDAAREAANDALIYITHSAK